MTKEQLQLVSNLLNSVNTNADAFNVADKVITDSLGLERLLSGSIFDERTDAGFQLPYYIDDIRNAQQAFPSYDDVTPVEPAPWLELKRAIQRYYAFAYAAIDVYPEKDRVSGLDFLTDTLKAIPKLAGDAAGAVIKPILGGIPTIVWVVLGVALVFVVFIKVRA